MNQLPNDMENTLTGSQSSHASLRDVHSINPTQLMARIESYEGREKKGISDVRRTFCLFVTFDLLFVTLLWIIELNVNGGIENTLEKEVVQYDYYSSYFDIFLLAVFRFKVLILAYAVCRLRHWWAIALTTAVTSAFLLAKVILSKLFSQGAFGYVLPIISFILAWIETWFLDFKVLPQEAEEENRLLIVQDASERAALIPAGLSDGQFYSPPESEAGLSMTENGSSVHQVSKSETELRGLPTFFWLTSSYS
ncbi:MLN64 N-terminal domain-like protein [Sciurus carolinensis]|uniref:MLN64 N-terminal domain-like protein n=1 Tax=Sciurus carolinensis TaxID=30640 RepID=A0AA41N5B7_SCICA|nr:MLN64 N-terminal domain-like protein [Sciurus carolinensis]